MGGGRVAMPTATYMRTTDMGDEDNGRKALALVAVDGLYVDVPYWPSILTQFPKAENRAYLEAEALHSCGYCADAKAHLTPLATGTDTRMYDEVTGALISGEDTRSWAQRWIEEHPDPAAATPAVDPLLGP